MGITGWLTLGGILITIAGSIARWWILRGAKKAGKLEERLEQKEYAEILYRDINEMARVEDEAMLKRLQGDDAGDGADRDSDWVPDRTQPGR